MSVFKRNAAALMTLLLFVLGHVGIDFVKTARGAENGAPAANNNLGDAVTAAELGVDVYPGARQSTRPVRMKLTGQHFTTVKFVTPDSRDQVLAFYKGRLGAHAVTSFHLENAIVSRGNNSSKDMVQVTIVPNSHVDGGKTQITILHTMKD